MGLFKGLLLGSTAAAVMATGSAFAADLPSRKAAPVAYVKICDVYGRGFYYIPGTNTCLKVGGRMRFQVSWHKAQNAFAGTGSATPAAVQDTLGWRARAYVNMDARTQTAWGTVQTVTSIIMRSRSGTASAGGGFTPKGMDGSNVSLDAAYIRFAGLTFGRAPWIFASGPGHIFYASNFTGGSPIGTVQLAYTAVLGGGFSATIGLEDMTNHSRQQTATALTNLNGTPGVGVHPNRLPNVVATLSVNQGWGSLDISGAAGQTKGVTGSNTSWSKTGWAVGTAAVINVPSLARGDKLYLFAAYSSGLLDYLTTNTMNGSIAKDGRRMGGYTPTHNNVAIYCVDALCATTGVESVKAMVGSIAFTHYWTPTVRSNFVVSAGKFTPGTNAKAANWSTQKGMPTSTSWQVAHQVVWSPTSGFDLGLEVYYAKTKNTFGCGANCTTWVGNTGGMKVKQNPDDLAVIFRAQRTF